MKQAMQQKAWASRSFSSLYYQAQSAVSAGYSSLPAIGSSLHIKKANGILESAMAGRLGDRSDFMNSAADGLVAYAKLYPQVPWTSGLGRLIPTSALDEALWFIPLVEAYDLLYTAGVLSSAEKTLIENSLIRAAIPVFKIDNYANDPRSYQLYKASNHHAYHLAAVGLAGLALGDAALVDWAVNHQYGFRYFVGHCLRDDGLHWERSMAYHRYALNGLLRFTEAAYRCGLDLYGIRTTGMADLVVENHYSTDVTELGKGLKMAFEALPQMQFPNGSYPCFGDGDSFWSLAAEQDLVGLRRYRTPALAWHAERNNVLDPLNGNAGPAFGFLHYNNYNLQYSNVRLGGKAVKWTRVDPTFTVASDGTVRANYGGKAQPSRYLTSEASGSDYVLEWNLRRVDSLTGQSAYLVFRSQPDNPGSGMAFWIGTGDMTVGRDYAYRMEVSGTSRRLTRNGVLISSSPVLGPSWNGDWRTMLALASMGDLSQYRTLARQWAWADGTFANSGQVRNDSSLLPSTGIAVLREKTGDGDWKGTISALSYGPYGGGHGHAAQLGMVMYSGGRQWVPQFDSMPYGSAEKGRWTTHTISHNTVVVGKVSQNPVGTSTVEWPSDSSSSRVQGRLVQFDGARKRVVAESEKAYPGLKLRRTQQLSGHHLVDDFTVEPTGTASTRSFDYVLHIEGQYQSSSFGLSTTSGALGASSGYQYVQKRMTAAVSAPGWVRYQSAGKSLKVWVVPTPGKSCQLILADGPSESTGRRVPMLILSSSGTSAAFTTVLEESEGAVETLGSASIKNNQLTLDYGSRSETVTLGTRWGTVTPDNPPNSVPVAVADTATTRMNTAVSGNLAANDTASADGGNVWSRATSPANGTATVNSNGSYTYTPATSFTGTDRFTYTLRDGNGDSATATVTITVTSGTASNVPVAVADAFTTRVSTVLNGNLGANDLLSSDGGHLWYLWSTPAHGTLVVNADGTFRYTPTTGYVGGDRFTYALRDGTYDRSNAEVLITVTATANSVPTAVADTATTARNTAVSGNLAANDTPSADGGNVWSRTTAPANGAATVNSNGSYTYTPASTFTGTDRFTYTIRDANGDSSTAAVTITVTSGVASNVPVAVADSYSTPVSTVLTGNLGANDTLSSDGGHLWYLWSTPARGTVIVNGDGTFRYTPTAGYTGGDRFTYALRDGSYDRSNAEVLITVTAATASSVPVAADDAFTTRMSTTLTGNLAANDTLSRDGGHLWWLWSTPAHGTVTVNADGTFRYTPTTGYTGTDRFTYALRDGTLDQSNAAVLITVSGSTTVSSSSSRVPVARADTATVAEDTTLSGNLAANDTPSADGGNVWSLATAPSHGTATVNANGTYTYRATWHYNGPDSFTYRIRDANGDVSTATVSLTITPVNDVPVAVNDTFTTTKNKAVGGNLATNDAFSGDGGNYLSRLTAPANGTATVNSNGTFTYTPKSNYVGTDSFTYRLRDRDGDTSNAKVTITVR